MTWSSDHSFSSWLTLLALAWAPTLGCSQEPTQIPAAQPGAEAQVEDPDQDPQAPGDAASLTPSDFVRFVVDGQAGRLDTAITTYRKGPIELVLYGAVHIADAAHYRLLQERFTTRDALLYELVAPKDTRPVRGAEKGGALSLLQTGLKNALELEFQLDGVDYSPENFVHADMTPGEFAASMEERGESILSIMFKMMQNGPAMQEAMAEMELPDVETDLVKAFRSGTGRHSMRMLFASQLEQIELMSAGGGAEGSTLLEGRNEKCLQVLQREIAAGKRRIGIYYGAAHFLHMEKRLVNDLGFHKTGHEWIPAWDCQPRPDPKFDRTLYIARRNTKRTMAKIVTAVQKWLATGGTGQVTMEELTAMQGEKKPYYTGDTNDAWGNPFAITIDFDSGRGVTVMSAGPDGERGTDDDLDTGER